VEAVSPKRPDDRVNLNAPVLPVDYPLDGEPIWPCSECLPWHVEFVVPDDGEPYVREWHPVGCPILEMVDHIDETHRNDDGGPDR
jgi:hypothetical protein